MKEKGRMKRIIILLLIIFLSFFLRIYKLESVPAGFLNDEASIGYDAYSILNTGRDQWGELLPITSFKQFGDYRPPVYIYLSVLPIKIFGLNEFSIRLPSALFGVLSTIIIYLLAKKMFDYKTGLLSAFIFAISPWSIGLSRVALESVVAMGLLLLGIAFFLKHEKKFIFLLLSVLCFILSIYTYSAYTLFSPLVFLTLVIYHRKYFYSRRKELLVSFFLFILLFSPLLIKNKLTANVRFSQVGIINNINSIGLKNILNDKRGSCLKAYPSFICKISDNKITLFVNNALGNYLSHFSFNFLYISGTVTQYSILPQRGLEFIFGGILLAIGFFWCITKRNKESLLILSLFLISPIPDSLTGDGHYARASLMLPFLTIIEGIGLIYIYNLFRRIEIQSLKYSLFFFLVIISVFSLFSFYLNYLTYFRDFYSRYSHYGYKQLMRDAYFERNSFDRIYISKHFIDTKQYIFYLFFNKYDPVKYQNKSNVSYVQEKDGWISVNRIDNIYFVENLPSIPKKSDLSKKRILLISTPLDFPKNIKERKEIKDYLGNVILKEVELKELFNYY